jgi:alpha-L-rhamnosidase
MSRPTPEVPSAPVPWIKRSGLGACPGIGELQRLFRDPPASYSVSPYWFWNGRITPGETRRQIAEMVAQGVSAAVVFNWSGLEPAYLSDAYWEQVGVALDAAQAAGLTLNFADEYLWPSGQAWVHSPGDPEPSRVLQLHPEFRMRRLSCRRVEPGGLSDADVRPEVVVAARLGADGDPVEDSLTLLEPELAPAWSAPGPGWILFVYTLVPAFERGVRVDLLNPAAVRAFIGLAYEPFARRFRRHLGTTIRFFVSDHEGTYGSPLPYTPALWHEFERRNGYDLRRLLPIADRETPGAPKLRRDYLNTVSELYAASHVGQVTEWCARHGVEHGHSDIEESIRFQVMWVGDMFRLWRASSVVYFDALVERGRMPVDFQEAASVAHFEGRPLVVENQGLTGMDSYWSLEKARLGTNMCLLWGVNRLMPHYFEYDPEHVQYPPSWFLAQPLWRYFRHYADVCRRGLFMNSTGRHEAKVAIYYPLESAFSNAGSLLSETARPVFAWRSLMDQTQEYYSGLQLELPREGWAYHILDAHYMTRAAQEGPTLELAGERFEALILPPMTHLEEASAEKIRRFALAGGRVLALGPQPASLDDAPMLRFPIREHPPFMANLDYTRRIEVAPAVKEDLAPLFEALRATVPVEVEIVEGERTDLYFARRFTDDAEWFWAVNDSGENRRVRARFPRAGTFERWDAETGERASLAADGAQVELEFGPFDAFYVVRHDGPETAPALQEAPARTLAQLPDEGWLFTPESPVRVPYVDVEGEPEPFWLSPERLSVLGWWLAGPYPDRDGLGLFDPFPPERGFVAGDPSWKWCESPTPMVEPLREVFGRQTDFHKWVDPHPERGGIYYAFVHVWSSEARDGVAAVVAAESVKLWWNGRHEHTARPHFPFIHLRDAWCDRVPVRIEKGWNEVLLKVGRSAAGPTGFLFRMADKSGSTLRDLVFSKDKVLPAAGTPRLLSLKMAVPPGTSGTPLRGRMDESGIPERPVVFEPKPEVIRLQCWSDSGLAHYAGSALYERDFDLGPALPSGRIWLDLGSVGLAAEAWINGTPVGERAWRPYLLDITRAARPGMNRLKVRVANSNAGWMAQGPSVYQSDAFWSTDFITDRDRVKTLRPNGLEGPVRILAGR